MQYSETSVVPEQETALHDIVVVGGSAGGIESLRLVLKRLAPDLPAAIFVVIHTLPRESFLLPSVLSSYAALPAREAADGLPFERGVIHVAPPDFHLLLEGGRTHLRRGPREHRTRPAIDPLFRSAAMSYGPRVIGILLSGHGGDGTLGMRAIKACGGIGFVESPEHAWTPDLPHTGLTLGGADSAVRLERLGERINELVHEPPGAPAAVPWSLMLDVRQALREPSPRDDESGAIVPPVLGCPTCAGPVQEEWHEGRRRYRCRVGHEFEVEQLEKRLSGEAHRALWIAVRTHEQHAVLAERMAHQEAMAGRDSTALLWGQRASESREHARAILAHLGPPVLPAIDSK